MDIRQNANNKYYSVALTDAWADVDKRFVDVREGIEPLDDWNEPNKSNYFGNFGQFKKLKDFGIPFTFGLSIV